MARINKINRSGAVNKMLTDWLDDGRDRVERFSRMEQAEMLDTVDKMTRSNLADAERALEIKNRLQKRFK